MRAVVQRVSHSQVSVDNKIVGKIAQGLNVLLGVTSADTQKDADYLVNKILGLRIFADSNEKMNLSVQEIQGSILVISQFTLYGDCRKGKRPSFVLAAPLEQANELYEYFVTKLRDGSIQVETGIFQAEMEVEITNDGPVTILLDSSKLF